MDGELMNEQGARVVQRVQGQKRLKQKKERANARPLIGLLGLLLPSMR